MNWMFSDKNDRLSLRRIAVSIKSIKMSRLFVCVYTRSLGDIWNNAILEKRRLNPELEDEMVEMIQ